MGRIDGVTEQDMRGRGQALLVWGCIWFTLSLFWLPPLMLVFGWFRLPDKFYAVLLPSEFVMSAIMAATGAVLWNSAAKPKVSPRACVAAYSCAAMVVIAVFKLYGWFR
jgi:hypothetical protein